MLVVLGFLMIATFMGLIMSKRLTPLLALIIVPTVFGLFTGAGLGLGDMVMDSVKDMSSTAALLMFAIIYFGLMIDVGLFDKLVNLIVRATGHDPAKVVVGTMILTALVSLDGDGSTTYIVVTAAMLPVYQREAMWLSFSASEPAALQIGVGKVCAVSGLPWIDHLVGDLVAMSRSP